MQSLYRDAVPEHDFTFDADTLGAALERIYHREIDPAKQIDEGLFREMWGILNHAADQGFAGRITDREADFLDAIRYNNALFSAFKVHRLQGDVGAQLLDADGRLKSFTQWRADVQNIVSHHTELWLETEYDTAIKRADLAAEWVQFEREVDILPNLRWVESISITPRESHRVFWGIVKPLSDPFWAQHRPGDEWGCKCSLEATDDPASDSIPNAPGVEPARGLQGNPAHTRKIFSDDHPYIANAYKGADKAVKSLLKELGIEVEEIKERKFKSRGVLQIPKGLKQNVVEEKKNLKAYTELAKLHGGHYKLLSVRNVQGMKNPDALNLKTGYYSDMKWPESMSGKNAIQTSIKSASKQKVEEAYIYLERDYPAIEIYRGLITSLRPDRAHSLRTIIIRLHDGTLKRYDVAQFRQWVKK